MTGHAFVRPGQVAPDLPPPDNCMRCGLPEREHRGADLAEAVAGRAILADFQRAAHEFTVGTRTEVDWLTWALSLGQHLQQLLDALGRPGAEATHVRADGRSVLSPDDLGVVLMALWHAARDADGDAAVTYDALRHRLGDDR
jgi:hypothetical protein